MKTVLNQDGAFIAVSLMFFAVFLDGSFGIRIRNTDTDPHFR